MAGPFRCQTHAHQQLLDLLRDKGCSIRLVAAASVDIEPSAGIPREPVLGRDRLRNLVNGDVVVGIFLFKVGAFEQLQDFLGPHGGQQIIDAFALRDVPGDRCDFCTSRPQLARQLVSCNLDQLILVRVRVKGDDHTATIPRNEVEVGDYTLDVAPVAVWSSGLADNTAPVPNPW